MQPISFSIPYDLDETNPKFSGLVSLIEMYRREGESLFAYIKDEAANIRKQVTAEAQALVDRVVWVFNTENVGTTDKPRYRIVGTPTLDGNLITENKALLSQLHFRDNDTQRKSFTFHFVNNVMLVDRGGYYMHYVDNGTIVEDYEIGMFSEGNVPERFRNYGETPKS